MGNYELGRTLGEGTFAKVKFARNVVNGQNVAIKIIDKEKVMRNKMVAQVFYKQKKKRERIYEKDFDFRFGFCLLMLDQA